MNWDIQLFKLNYDDLEVKAVSDVVAGGWLSMGEKIISFEEKFGDFLGDAVCRAIELGVVEDSQVFAQD